MIKTRKCLLAVSQPTLLITRGRRRRRRRLDCYVIAGKGNGSWFEVQIESKPRGAGSFPRRVENREERSGDDVGRFT